MKVDAPQPDEVEVSVFGHGRGESIVVHMTQGQWMIVDSCLNRDTGVPAPLEYLQQIGVDVPRSLVLVVASHWHDDHIAGMAEVLRNAPDAEFACSVALRHREFLALVAAEKQIPIKGPSGVREFAAIFEHLRRTGAGPTGSRGPAHWVAAYTTLRRQPSSVVALSPSPASITTALSGFGRFIQVGSAKKETPADIDANQTSVVLWVEVNNVRVLLGADLEETGRVGEGWTAIIGAHQRPPGTASVYKIAHHGSPNADIPAIWSDLLDKNPHAVLTAYAMGRKPRPAVADIRRIRARTESAYLTSPASGFSPRTATGVIGRMLSTKLKNRRRVIGPLGHVRLRRRAGATDWSVALRSPASKLEVRP